MLAARHVPDTAHRGKSVRAARARRGEAAEQPVGREQVDDAVLLRHIGATARHHVLQPHGHLVGRRPCRRKAFFAMDPGFLLAKNMRNKKQ